MLLLEAYDLECCYADRLIFQIPQLHIYQGDRIGIVGLNGAGKTTLLNVLSGTTQPDAGVCKRGAQLAYIRQFSSPSAREQPRGRLVQEFSLQGKLEREERSGGEETRLRIANALGEERVLLFADEPTANLDAAGIALLTEKLMQAETLVLVSHDRSLLDALCTRIWELKDGALREYEGNYSDYLLLSEREKATAQAEYDSYAAQRSRLQRSASGAKERARGVRKAPKRMGNSEARLHKREATETQEKLNAAAKSLQTRLEKLEVKEKPREEAVIRLDFALTDPPQNKILLSCKQLSFGYGDELLFEKASFSVENGSKTALFGANGAGKTTLLNLIANGHLDIYQVPKLKIGYFRQDLKMIDGEKTVLDNVLRGSVQSVQAARAVLARLLFRADEVQKRAAVLSGGEKIKLCLAMLLTSEANMLILDEPTNYLDIHSLEAVQALLCDYAGTILFVSHDRSVTQAVADHLLFVEDKTLRSFTGKLCAYEAQRVKPKAPPQATQKLVLQMQMEKILADITAGRGELEVLEAQYQALAAQLNPIEEK